MSIGSLITAAFMALGLREGCDQDHILEHWDAGHLELISQLVEYAPYTDKLWLAAKEHAESCGVFDYEVSEEFGRWFGDQVLLQPAGGNAPTDEACSEKLRELTLAFFAQGIDDPKQIVAVSDTLNAVPTKE